MGARAEADRPAGISVGSGGARWCFRFPQPEQCRAWGQTFTASSSAVGIAGWTRATARGCGSSTFRFSATGGTTLPSGPSSGSVTRIMSFRALADHRGLPRVDFEPGSDEPHGESWMSWAELTAADWGEAANEVDGGVHEYRLSTDGAWKMQGRNSDLTRFAELSGLADARQLYCAGNVYAENNEWPDRDRLFRVGPPAAEGRRARQRMGRRLVGHPDAGAPARRRRSPLGRLFRRLAAGPDRPKGLRGDPGSRQVRQGGVSGAAAPRRRTHEKTPSDQLKQQVGRGFTSSGGARVRTWVG